MDAVTLTFPGHFFQTALSIRSIQRFYKPTKHYVILDDLERGSWDSYVQDARELYGPDYVYITTSSIPRMEQTLSGWWRQQLIKLTIDTLIPGDAWLLVDGDVIFESFCPYDGIVPVASHEIDNDGAIEKFTRNYIRSLLGVDQAQIYHDGHPSLTNPVPYRWLARPLLEKLRSHVEQRFGDDFVDLHIRWFHDQTIVGMHEDPTKWSMSEWELIEVFRDQVLGEKLPTDDSMGAGYPIDTDISDLDLSRPTYKHGYIRDSQTTPDWFVKQGIDVSKSWQHSRRWLETREPWRA